jgi:hypothetical protein
MKAPYRRIAILLVSSTLTACHRDRSEASGTTAESFALDFTGVVAPYDPYAYPGSPSSSPTPELTSFHGTVVVDPYTVVVAPLSPYLGVCQYCGLSSPTVGHGVIVQGTTDDPSRCARLRIGAASYSGHLTTYPVDADPVIRDGTCNGCPESASAGFSMVTFDCATRDPATSWTYVGDGLIGADPPSSVHFTRYPTQSDPVAEFSFADVILYPYTQPGGCAFGTPCTYPAGWGSRPHPILVSGSGRFRATFDNESSSGGAVPPGYTPPLCSASGGSTGGCYSGTQPIACYANGHSCTSQTECQSHTCVNGRCCTGAGLTCNTSADCCSTSCNVGGCCD